MEYYSISTVSYTLAVLTLDEDLFPTGVTAALAARDANTNWLDKPPKTFRNWFEVGNAEPLQLLYGKPIKSPLDSYGNALTGGTSPTLGHLWVTAIAYANDLELALLCVRMFLDEYDKIERYVGGLLDMIHESVAASKPKTMQDATEIATELMDKRICTFAERTGEKKPCGDINPMTNAIIPRGSRSRPNATNATKLAILPVTGHFKREMSKAKEQTTTVGQPSWRWIMTPTKLCGKAMRDKPRLQRRDGFITPASGIERANIPNNGVQTQFGPGEIFRRLPSQYPSIISFSEEGQVLLGRATKTRSTFQLLRQKLCSAPWKRISE
ncbi:hypothetical protein Tco_1081842 [Tanacetum coccineum]|uniref:Uncharacterized protein n=1 Tax=Tanacetum coccineum TaxID=301880 RepID=A0ABQ5I0E0_9ASTR